MANGSVANGKAKTPLPANPLGNFCTNLKNVGVTSKGSYLTNIVGLHYSLSYPFKMPSNSGRFP